jgi:hypothetical protein
MNLDQLKKDAGEDVERILQYGLAVMVNGKEYIPAREIKDLLEYYIDTTADMLTEDPKNTKEFNSQI